MVLILHLKKYLQYTIMIGNYIYVDVCALEPL